MKGKNGKNKTTLIDVGIPALNEEKNIINVLKSVSSQKGNKSKVNKIILVSDNSTDDTVKKAKSLKLKNLKIIENKQRKGVAYGWGKIFQESNADILTLIDADIALEDKNTLEKLVSPLIENKSLTLVSGHPVKVNTGTFTDKVMNVSLYLQEYVKVKFRDGTSIYGCHGRIVAVKKNIYKKLRFPPIHILGNDSYIYLFNKSRGGRFLYVPEARAKFKMPQKLSDFQKQMKRFAGTPGEHKKFFGDWAKEEYKTPINIKLEALFTSFIKKPFYTTCYVIIRFYYQTNNGDDGKPNYTWDASSTKSLD